MDLSRLSDAELDSLIASQSNAPLSVRNNNPGNIRSGPNGFKAFGSPQEGLDAMQSDLSAKISGRSNAMASRYGPDYVPTLRNVISVYAPPSENDTNSYIGAVAQRTGLDPDAPLTADNIPALQQAMIRHEGGDVASQYYTPTNGLANLSDDELEAQIAALSPKQVSETPKQVLQQAFEAKRGIPSGSGRAFANAVTGGTIPFGNRITSALGAGIGTLVSPITNDPRTFSEMYGESLADTQATAAANPKATLAGNLVGIAETLPLVSARTIGGVLGKVGDKLIPNVAKGTINAIPTGLETAANFARSGSNLGTQALRSAALASPVGALFGAGDAAPGEMLEGAAIGGGLGFGLGATVPVLGRLAVSGGNKIIDKIALNRAQKAGEIPAGFSADTATKKVYNRLLADYGGDVDALKSALRSYASKGDQSLVEKAGARVSNLAEGAAQYPSGQAAASEFFEDAIGRVPETLKKSVARNISPNSNYYDTLDQIVESGRAAAGPLYTQAYKANQQVSTPIIERILRTPEGKSALSDAVLNMQNEMALVSKADPELTQMAREAGLASTGHGVGNGLKLRTLDYVKRSMDSTINAARRAGDESQVRRIQALKSGLVSELDNFDKTGSYARARKTSGDYLSASDAAEFGKNFLREDAELIKRNFANYGPTEKRAFKTGVVKAIRNDIDNKVDGQNLARIFGKGSTRDKLQSVLPQKEYKALLDDAMASDKIYKLRNQIVSNSRTASRQIGAKEFESEAAQTVDDLISKGATRTAIDRVSSIIAKQFDGLSDKLARDVSEILYETDTKKKYKILRDLTNLSKQNSPKSTNAGKTLQAYYGTTDAISKNKDIAATPLTITVTPRDKK